MGWEAVGGFWTGEWSGLTCVLSCLLSSPPVQLSSSIHSLLSSPGGLTSADCITKSLVGWFPIGLTNKGLLKETREWEETVVRVFLTHSFPTLVLFLEAAASFLHYDFSFRVPVLTGSWYTISSPWIFSPRDATASYIASPWIAHFFFVCSLNLVVNLLQVTPPLKALQWVKNSPIWGQFCFWLGPWMIHILAESLKLFCWKQAIRGKE